MFPQGNDYQSLLPKNAHGSPNFDKAACINIDVLTSYAFCPHEADSVSSRFPTISITLTKANTSSNLIVKPIKMNMSTILMIKRIAPSAMMFHTIETEPVRKSDRVLKSSTFILVLQN